MFSSRFLALSAAAVKFNGRNDQVMGCPFVSQTLVATHARAREAVTSNFVFLIAMQDGQGLAPEYIKALSIYGCIGCSLI
jgi:hypothetical protein